MMMTKEEREQVKELAARMTPELMKRILAIPSTPSEKESAAVMILACCAKAMMEGDPLTRMEAYDVHESVLRWAWDDAAHRSWKGTQIGEVL